MSLRDRYRRWYGMERNAVFKFAPCTPDPSLDRDAEAGVVGAVRCLMLGFL